jgi:SOS response regulatory protein OraA/RecX
VATVTALRSRRGAVAIELDGTVWRSVPPDVAARAGLAVGLELDRPRLRILRRELRRHEALDAAGRALRTRDLSRRALAERVAGAVGGAAGAEALATLERVGLVDDGRVARARAATLAERGYGDAAIRHDLGRRGLEADAIEAAIGALAAEPVRAAAIIERRGTGPRTARFLASKGFTEDTAAAALGPGFANSP